MSKFVFVVENDFEERRNQPDRRTNFTATTFPVITKQGTWIRKECRKTPERRVDNINVDETQVDAEEFKELFKDYADKYKR